MPEISELDPFKLPHPPIVEAVFDIDCDLPPALNLEDVEKLGEAAFGEHYPKPRKQFIQEAGVEMKPDAKPKFFTKQGLSALQFLSEDEKQIVQIRVGGFSFNRLAPYTSFDDYLPEISKCWDKFRGIADPKQIRKISLRYINRIPLPMDGGKVTLTDYLEVSPNLPDGVGLQFAGFFHQHQAGDPSTGMLANIILASQPNEGKILPLILDIEVFKEEHLVPAPLEEWQDRVTALRDLKNRIFKYSLTEKCLSLFH